MTNKSKAVQLIFFYKSLVFLLLSFFITSHANSQTLPNYQERSFEVFSDSIKSLFTFDDASEGIIESDSYLVGPGDKFLISISGLEEILHIVQVNPEGNIYIPRLGGVVLRNKTLSESKNLIEDALNKVYKNVDIFISLSEFRKIKVSLVGDVKKPSTYILKSNSRLLDLISLSEGFNASADFRNIIIRSKDDKQKTFDLLTFLRKGDYNQNPYLNEGDVVIIDRADKMVFISGSIKYPAFYEYVENETAFNLIQLAGGLLNDARKDSIEIVRFAEDGLKQFSLFYNYDELRSKNIKIQNRDHLIVRKLPEYLIGHYVHLEGKIKYPGWYRIAKDKTRLSEIVREAGGFLEDASLVDSYILRQAPDKIDDPEFERLKLLPRADMTDDEYDYFKARSRQKSDKVVVNFEKLFKDNDTSEDIILKRNDYIFIPEKQNYVLMLGQVVNPGKIIYNPSFTINDYIMMAGGFGWRALERDVRVIKVNTGEWIDADDVDKIDPGDTIWVPEDPPGPKFWDVFTTSLQVLGQVAAIVAATVAVIVATR